MRNVLVIDDSSTTRLYYRDNLARLGFVVREAINGIEGLELAVQDRFDLILVDLNMPKMDGYTFLDQLRRRSEAPTAPVVMISTLAREAGRAKRVTLREQSTRRVGDDAPPVSVVPVFDELLAGALRREA